MRSEQFRRKLLCGAGFAALGAAGLLAATPAAAQSAVVDAGVPTVSFTSPPQAGAYVGQTFLAPATTEWLNKFEFDAFKGTATLVIQGWNGSGPTGPVLFSQALNNASLQPAAVFTNGLQLVSGQSYVVYVDLAGEVREGGAPDSYAGGEFVENYSGSWSSVMGGGYDWVFSAAFSSAGGACGATPLNDADNTCAVDSTLAAGAGADGLGGTDTLQLGGSTDFSFDVGRIGADFVNFEGVHKTGASIVTLTGTDTAATDITISDGAVVGTTDSIQGNVTLDGTAGVTTGPVLAFDQSTNGTYAGNMGGTGVLAKLGTGEVTLTGTNTFQGVISVVGGKLIGDTDAINVDATVGAGAAVVFDQATNATYDGNINGGGALEKRGAGTLTLTGNSNYDGGTLISGGKLVGDTDSLQGAITNNAQLEFAMNSNGTFQGTSAGTFGSISGSGSVTKSGTGTLTIGGANSYGGGTSITGGTVKIDNVDGLGTGTVFLSGGSLRVDATGTFDNQLSFTGAGGTFSAATGDTVTLTGVVTNAVDMHFGSATDTGVIVMSSSSASGTVATTLHVDGGTLRSGNSVLGFIASHIATVDVASGATLDFAPVSEAVTIRNLQGAGTVSVGANALTLNAGSFDGVLSGSGGLTKATPGTLRLSGNNTLTGATLISGGKLTVADGAALSDTGAVTVNSPAIFDVEDSETIGSLAGAGSVTLQSGAVLTTGGDNTSTTLSGGISGQGGLTKTGSGVFTLTGTNSYSGGTTVLAGELVGTTSSLQGAITNDAEVSFDQTTNGTYAGAMTGTGVLNKRGTGTVSLTGSVDVDGGVAIEAGTLISVDSALASMDVTNDGVLGFDNSGTGTFAGDIEGTGSLVKLGAGSLTLSGDNSYSGGTSVEAGRLIGAVGSLQGDISVLAGAAVEFAQGSNATYGGDLSGGGVLVKSGAGKLTLTGTNTLSGISVSGGILQGTTDNLVGDIDNDAQVIFAQGSTGTYAGDMSGTGSLVKTGNGALTLSGTNSYTGGTTVSNGSLIGTTDSLQGNIVNNAQLVFNQGASGTYAGNLSGSGDVTFQGGSSVWYELTGTNTSTGDMNIDGSVVLADTDAIAGDIDLLNDGRLILDQEFDGTYGGDITGTGVFTKQGNGSVRLTGSTSHSGGTNVMAGNLIGDTHALRGSIFTYYGGYLVFDQGFDAAFDGEMSGFGGFVKQGVGTLTISDTQIMDDLSYLQAGRLTVNGSIGALQVTSGTLNGTGTVGSLSVLGGVVAPGNSIGALHVNGGLLLGANSLLQIEAKPGSSDRIVATGGATLQGGDVALIVQPGFYAPGTSWTILQAASVSGAFGDLTASQSFGLLDPRFVYGSNSVAIKLVFDPENLYPYAETDNQLAAAHGVGGLPESAAVLTALVYAPTTDLPDALDQLSGEMQASLASALLDDNSFAVDATTTRLRNHDPMTPGWGVWATARTDRMSLEGDPGVATLERTRDAFLTGMDYTYENGLRLGVAIGADQGDAEVADRGSKAETNGWMAEAYGRLDFGRNTLRFGAGVGNQDVSTTRTVVIGSLTEVNTGETEARTANAFIELARSYGQHGALEFEPFIGGGWAKAELDGYAETGGSSALAIGDVEVDSSYALAGLRVSQEFDLGGGLLKPMGSLAWENPFGEPEAAVVNSFITAPGAPFAVRGSDLDGGRALMELGLQWESGDFKVGLTYEGAASEDFQRHGGKLYARLAF